MPDAVGRVVGLWRYPVKSMAGQTLSDVDVSWHGVSGDRRWAFVRDAVPQSGFPWFTLRERHDLSEYLPSFSEPDRPDSSDTVVRTPTGGSYDVADPALAMELSDEPLRVIRQDRGIFDTFPLSLITTQTVAKLGDLVGAELEARRFRPNLLVEATDDEPFQEDDWVGDLLRIGGLTMRVDKRDGRCVVITIDPVTHQRNRNVLRTVNREREGCLGVYGSTVSPGRVALNDPVILEPSD